MTDVIVIIFSKDGGLVYFNDLEGLLQELGCTNNLEGWILFVDFCIFVFCLYLNVSCIAATGCQPNCS
jgi:hypothetical protein